MAGFIGSEQPVTSSDLDEVERAFGFSFPAAFRGHYLRHNGGSPEEYLFKQNDTVFVVNNFFPIKYGRINCLFEDVFRDLKIERQVLPKHLVAFADDPGGDYYCFSVGAKDAGTIWIYRGEYSDEPDRAVQLLAKSLNEFVENMVAEQEGA